MSVEEQLVDLLGDDTAVAAVIDDRIFPVALYKQAALPALTYQRVRGSYQYALDGSVAWSQVTVALSAWADNYPDARELAEAVKAVLNPYTAETPGSIEVGSVEDGADTWIESMNLFGCVVLATVEWGGSDGD